MRRLLDRFQQRNSALLVKETEEISGFMSLLMKQRNTGVRWTREEIAEFKVRLRRPSIYAPVLTCLLLPGGFLVLPLIAALLDRRKVRRIPPCSAGEAPAHRNHRV